MSKNIRVLIADDHTIFRDGLKSLFKNKLPEHYILIGEAVNGKQVLDMLEQQEADIVLSDIQMPVMDGIESSLKIKQLYPKVGVIGLSMFAEPAYVIDMFEAGAKGYLLKNVDSSELALAIQTVYDGGIYYSKEVSNYILKELSDHKGKIVRRNLHQLTDIEIDIIKQICFGKTNKEIALALRFSKRTIESYRERLMGKIRARNTADVIAYALKHDLYHI